MTTLAEIERAADELPPEQQGELLVHLAERLRSAGPRLPEPRTFTAEQIAAWIAQDEADAEGVGEWVGRPPAAIACCRA